MKKGWFYHLVQHHPYRIIVTCLAITVIFGVAVPFVTVDNSTASFIPDTHPDVLALHQLEETFALGEAMVMGIRSPQNSILSVEYISLVRNLVNEIETHLLVESTFSLANLDNISVDEGAIVTEPILKDFEDTEVARDAVLYNLADWDLTKNLLISPDRQSMQVVIDLKPDLQSKEYEEVYTAVLDILDREEYSQSGLDFIVAGVPAVDVLISQSMFSDAALLTPLAFLVTMFVLFFFFRRLGGTILPLLSVFISIIWTVGLLTMMSVSISLLAAIMPVLLVAVGCAYSIHYTHRYYYEYLERQQEPAEAVVASLKTVWLPILMAGLTTVAGFISLSFTKITPIRDFAVFTAIGVFCVVIIALTFVPAMMVVFSRNRKRNAQNSGKTLSPRLVSLYKLLVQRRGTTVLLSIAVVIISIFGIPLIKIDNNVIKYFDDDSHVARADNFFNDHFLGTRTFHIMFQGDEPSAMTNVDILLAMDKLKQHLMDKYPEITAIQSYTDYIKRMNQIFYLSQQSAEELPEDDSDFSDLEIPNFGGEDMDDLIDLLGEDFFATMPEDAGSFELDTLESEDSIEESTSDVEHRYDLQTSDIDSEALLQAFHYAIATFQSDDNSMTVSDFVAQLSKTVNYRGAAYYSIPADTALYRVKNKKELSNLVSQYIFLYGDALSSWIDVPLSPSIARMQVFLNDSSTSLLKDIQDDVAEFSRTIPESYNIQVAGTTIVESALNRLVVSAQITSLAIAILIVFIILIITFRSFVAGLIGLSPIIISVLVCFSAMGILPVSLNISTAMAASIVIGVGIDYAIHYLHAYRREYLLNPRASHALRELKVFHAVGGAIFFNAISVALGFGVLLFSRFAPLRNLGLLIVLTMIFSALSALLLLPLALRFVQPFAKAAKRLTEGG